MISPTNTSYEEGERSISAQGYGSLCCQRFAKRDVADTRTDNRSAKGSPQIIITPNNAGMPASIASRNFKFYQTED